ncbi:MAG TPA: lipid-A-disaccharide synthase [Nitrospiria bacterium]|nr:lipid-A-disaccharide synthase [Nitrospiria bacterium]
MTSAKIKNILIVTGETSGDLHGGNLVKALLEKDSGINIFAVGGPCIKAAGGKIIFDNASLGVVGLTEVLTHLHVIRAAFQKITGTLKDESIDHLILIDYPDFNLRVARVARKMGIPVTYYISPQVWAWRKGRISLIRRLVSQMLVILPFEEEIYRKAGVPVEYVGHPLIEEIAPFYDKPSLKKEFGLDPDRPVIGLCPGSRESELGKLLPVMLASAKILRKGIPRLQFLLPVAPTFTLDNIQRRMGRDLEHVRPVKGDSSRVMAACDVIMVASGTATLQAAIIGVPMVVIYKVSRFTYWIGKFLLKIKQISLVNIISGDTIVTELIQDEANPDRISHEIKTLLNDHHIRNGMLRKLGKLRHILGERKASVRAAESVLRLLKP